jgi:hypothetical protein
MSNVNIIRDNFVREWTIQFELELSLLIHANPNFFSLILLNQKKNKFYLNIEIHLFVKKLYNLMKAFCKIASDMYNILVRTQDFLIEFLQIRLDALYKFI